MRLTYGEIAAHTGGALLGSAHGEAVASGLTWDSRTVAPGDLYVALPGERVDGHEFVAAALAAGASGALVSHEVDAAARAIALERGCALVRVPDAAAAITDLARAWRGRLTGRVIGLTGSCGKTTTKNLVRDVLAAAFSVVATQANQNNELGVPRTILAADEDTQTVVVEMGMRGGGQIARLCEVVRPDWGIVTNVGESHIELLGSRENIARAKGELLCALPAGTGKAFLNGADDYADFLVRHAALERRGVQAVCCGELRDADSTRAKTESAAAAAGAWRSGRAVWAQEASLDEQGRARFVLCARGFGEEGGPQVERVACNLELRGLHNVGNACLAAAVGRACGMPLELIAQALAQARPESGRQEVLRTSNGLTVVNDAYNANPDSMKASLATFCALQVPGRRVAVLGDMGELGDHAPACHERVGAFAATLPIDRLVCVGELSRHIAAAAERAGMPADRVVRTDTVEEALSEVSGWVRPGDAVLAKASHFMELERVVKGLVC